MSRVATAVTPVAVVVLAQVLLFPMPLGVWVQGVILGLLGALMAVGLGLVYRLNGVVNFAQGDLGSAPAVLAFGLIGFSGVNYFVGLGHRAGGRGGAGGGGGGPDHPPLRPVARVSCSRSPPSVCPSC